MRQERKDMLSFHLGLSDEKRAELAVELERARLGCRNLQSR
jgi:hypothetical protein